MILSKDEIATLLASRGLGPKHSLGQNFLIDQSILDKIVGAVNTAEPWAQNILEVGPGLGVLTDELVRLNTDGSKPTVLAVEQDHALAARLPKFLHDPSNLKVIPADFVRFNRAEWLEDGDYQVATNLPFNITNLFINTLYTKKPRPRQIVVMVQKEVAERLIAAPGDSARGLTSVMTEYYGTRELITLVPRNSFYPVPGVDAAVIKLTIDRALEPEDQAFFKLVKMVFAHRRKAIKNSLPAICPNKEAAANLLAVTKIDPLARPQDLTLEQWLDLSSNFHLS